MGAIGCGARPDRDPGLETTRPGIDPTFRWRTGDSLAWAAPDLDDSDWTAWRPDSGRIFDDWPGVGWFRLTVTVPPGYDGRPLHLGIDAMGAVEIFLDGERVPTAGRPGADPTAEVPRPPMLDVLRLVSLEPNLSDEPRTESLALRFSTFFLEELRFGGLRPRWALALHEPQEALRDQIWRHRVRTFHQAVLGGFYLAISLPFLALAWLRRRFDANVGYCLVALAVGANSAVAFHQVIGGFSPAGWAQQITLFNVTFVLMALVIVSASRSEGSPRGLLPSWLLGLLGSGIVAWSVVQPFRAQDWAFAFMLLANVEVIALSTRRRSASEGESERLLLWGAAPLILVGIYQVLVSLGWAPAVWNFFVFPAPYYAATVLMTTVAVYLARQFVRNERGLAEQLVRVQELSDEALESERRMAAREVEKARLEVDNARKSAELEEARRLQLEMLPTTRPQPPGFEIAVDMRTASEVGGDYYDFASAADGAQLLAIGDATGHGLHAGTLVAATKSAFQVTASAHRRPAEQLAEIATAIARLGSRRRHMALTLVRLDAPSREQSGAEVTVASAAMPPALLVRAGHGSVESVDLPAMPLGAFAARSFTERQLELEPGDVLVLATDGLPERRVAEQELLGYERFEAIVGQAVEPGRSAEATLAAIEEAVAANAAGALDDDATLVVVRRVDEPVE